MNALMNISTSQPFLFTMAFGISSPKLVKAYYSTINYKDFRLAVLRHLTEIKNYKWLY